MRFALLAALAVCAAAAPASTPPEQLFRQAVAAQKRGDLDTAIRTYRELLAQQPNIVEVRANLGAALSQEGRYDEAIAEYKAALALKDVPQLHMNLGLAYYKKGDFVSAEREFAPLLKLAPDNAKLATLAGDAAARQGHFDEAIRDLEPAARAHPDDLGLAWVLGAALIRSGQINQGLPLVERAAAQGTSAEADVLAGEACLDLNQFEKARDYASAALKIDAKAAGAHTLRGKALQFLNDYPGAKADLAEALAEDPADFDAHVTLAAIYNTERDLSLSQEHIDAALRLKPNAPLALFERARIERSEGKLAAAAADFEAVEKQDPNWLQPHVELAALYYRLGRPAEGARERAIVDKLNATNMGTSGPARSH
jgi:tetratricopeptide (TPR) repeat protein